MTRICIYYLGLVFAIQLSWGYEMLDSSIHVDAVKPFLEKHCIHCHGPEKQKGKLRLDDLAGDFLDSESAGKWIEVMDNINLGDMPPEDEPVPDATEIETVSRWIAAELRHAQAYAQSTGGRVLMRRLNRTEYANTVQDLLGVVFPPNQSPLDLLPPDGTVDGFDKVSKGLLLDPSLMEQYFDVAAAIADLAVVEGPPPVPTRRNRMEYEDIDGGIAYIKKNRSVIVREDGLISMNSSMRTNQKVRHPWSDQLFPIPGRYTIRLRLGADLRESEQPLFVKMERTGSGEVINQKIEGSIDQPEIIEVTRDFETKGGSELSVSIGNRTEFQRVNYYFADLRTKSQEASKAGDRKLAGRYRAQMMAEGMISQSRPHPDTRTTDHIPRVFFDWVEVEGPLYEQWPPRSTEIIFHRGVGDESLYTTEYLQEIFSRLLPRAFRRDVDASEVANIVGIATAELAAGESFPTAVEAGITAMLCSPAFLLLNEPSQDDAPRRVTNDELATRLSYFLWNSMPDSELTEADLGTADQILAQVERMLRSPKAEQLITGFGAQWLKAHEFDRFSVDRNLYRDYYSVENTGLNEAINAEPLAVFREILQTHGSVLDLLSSDWTMANEPLARHYGIEGVKGTQFQRVALPADSRRGGLVTMAAVHKWGSDGNRTKPVERGKYILEVLFNDPPDPPPPNVGEVEPNVSGELLTVRQRLDHHRTIESCAACHRRIDPYGLALENYNVIGKWRTKQDGERGWWPDSAVIDASGTMPNGTKFTDIDEFRTALLDQSDRFLRGLAEKMLTYALGRTVEPSDRGLIDSLVADMRAQGYSLNALIKGIATSEAFTTK